MNAYQVLAWARMKNCRIRFHSNGTVSIWFNEGRRRRANIVAAILAHDPRAEEVVRCSSSCGGSPHRDFCMMRFADKSLRSKRRKR